jgi:hypothetical protein
MQTGRSTRTVIDVSSQALQEAGVDKGVTYNISNVSAGGEDNGSSRRSNRAATNCPEQSDAMEHLAEVVARLIPQVQPLPELRPA